LLGHFVLVVKAKDCSDDHESKDYCDSDVEIVPETHIERRKRRLETNGERSILDERKKSRNVSSLLNLNPQVSYASGPNDVKVSTARNNASIYHCMLNNIHQTPHDMILIFDPFKKVRCRIRKTNDISINESHGRGEKLCSDPMQQRKDS